MVENKKDIWNPSMEFLLRCHKIINIYYKHLQAHDADFIKFKQLIIMICWRFLYMNENEINELTKYFGLGVTKTKVGF